MIFPENNNNNNFTYHTNWFWHTIYYDHTYHNVWRYGNNVYPHLTTVYGQTYNEWDWANGWDWKREIQRLRENGGMDASKPDRGIIAISQILY